MTILNAPPAPPAPPVQPPRPPASRPDSGTTVQAVLAGAGAGLFAIAAIVFTFFNPDLTDRTLRSLVLGAVTIVFLAAARVLARRGLRLSAETVGALGVVFVALDVYALSGLTAPGMSPWLPAAIATLGAGAVMAALAYLTRLRVWLWAAAGGLALTPAMLGAAGATELATTLGRLASAAAAIALVEGCRRVASRFDGRLRAERTTLLVLQFVAVLAALSTMWGIGYERGIDVWMPVAAVLATVSLVARIAAGQAVRVLWSLVSGGAAAGTALALGLAATTALLPPERFEWVIAIGPAAAMVGVVVVSGILPAPRVGSPTALLGGALVAALTAALPAFVAGGLSGLMALARPASVFDSVSSTGTVAASVGLAAVAAGFAALGLTWTRTTRALAPESGNPTTEPEPVLAPSPDRWPFAVAAWFAVGAVLIVLAVPGTPLGVRVALGVAAAASVAGALVFVPALRSIRLSLRAPLVVGAHLTVIIAALLTRETPVLAVAAGIPVLVTVALLARALPRSVRWAYAGTGYAYALLVFSVAVGPDVLGAARGPSLDGVARLCLTTSVAALVAIAATFMRRVGPRAWWAILAITAVPFAAGVIQVVFVRSGWTALSTVLIFCLALTLVATRRAGLGTPLRMLAAAVLVPLLAVVVVCLGAEVLEVSASPITLPIIAGIVALALPGAALAKSALRRRGMPRPVAIRVRLAIEASALLTGAIAVALGLTREATGLWTTFLALAILCAGAIAAALFASRPQAWWVAAATFAGALWCGWDLAGLGAASGVLLAVGTVTRNSSRARVPGRAGVRMLRAAALVGALAAAAAGPAQGVRLGLGLEGALPGIPVVAQALGVSAAGAIVAALASRALVRGAGPRSHLARTRWLYAPAFVYLAAGTWTAIKRDWTAVWTMWGLMLALLIAVVAIALRQRARGTTALPPVWFVFALAFVTAVVAWSPRDLRVEVFSLPLGLFLLAAGAVGIGAARDADGARATLNSWPARWTGSWALLAPGLITSMLASVIATFTDPLTWRAILVIVLALIAMLVGAGYRLAAPFLIGVIALPIENVFVFAVQIGRGIESMPWWITLAVVGAVLLIIAVTYERRADASGTLTARLRDLR